MKYKNLFTFMSEKHGVKLDQNEMIEIANAISKDHHDDLMRVIGDNPNAVPEGFCAQTYDPYRTKGMMLIDEERRRQIDEKGFTLEGDLIHSYSELANAAAAYCIETDGSYIPYMWPWNPDWFKPSPENRIRELQKAGALVAAEIDRLLKIKEK